MCEEADETTVLSKTPSWNHRCANHLTYRLERRRRDWQVLLREKDRSRYLWRSSNCLLTTISFEIRCGFPRDPRVFYRENQELFEYEDAEPSPRSPSLQKQRKPF